MSLLGEAFFQRDALDVAVDLLGTTLRRGGLALRITEVEAYRHPGDTANHCRVGPTPRNAPMWGPGGRLYVYQCYGLHQLLNVVTGRPGEGAAVLVRSAEIVEGRQVAEARGVRPDPRGLVGPGLVGRALGVDPTWSHHPVTEPGGVELHAGPAPGAIRCGPRIGVGYASEADRAAPWRIAAGETRAVARPRALRAGLPEGLESRGWRGFTSS